MSITTSKPKLLTAICNCCCTQNHQPLPFLLLPLLRENILTTPLPKGRKNTAATTNTTTIPKNKNQKKGIFFPPQSAEIPQVERRKKAQRGTLDFFFSLFFSFLFWGVLFKILELEERQNPIEST